MTALRAARREQRDLRDLGRTHGRHEQLVRRSDLLQPHGLEQGGSGLEPRPSADAAVALGDDPVRVGVERLHQPLGGGRVAVGLDAAGKPTPALLKKLSV